MMMLSDDARETASTPPTPSAQVEEQAGHFAHSPSEARGRPSARSAAGIAKSPQRQPWGSPESPRASPARAGATPERSERFFDPWLVCDHPAVQALAMRAVEEAELAELTEGRRTRQRSDKAREAFHALAQAVIANAAYAYAEDPKHPAVALPLGNSAIRRPNRYQKLNLGQIRPVLAALGAAYGPRRKGPSLITFARSRHYGIASVFRPGRQLQDCCTAADGFGLHSFHKEGGEAIVVRRVERSDSAYKPTRTLVDYEDTGETVRIREEMGRINEWLREANLSFTAAGDHPQRAPILKQRHLRRIFNTTDDTPRFDLNGRLYGGWWENLEREERPGIRIDGERVADLDFKAMGLRLAYLQAGLTPPDGDLYAGILNGPHREGVKRVVGAMLATTVPIERMPQGCRRLLPTDVTASELRERILSRHAPIRDQFERGLAQAGWRTESDILVAVLLRLIDLGIAALPLHDGLMVRYDKARLAAEIMGDVAEVLTGFRLPVAIDKKA